ncbi:DUF2442 domain-containing protein [Caballeronia sp. KNU42]
MTVQDDRYEAAAARGREEHANFAEDFTIEERKIRLRTFSGKSIDFPTDKAPGLAGASQEDIKSAVLISGGSALRFPTLNLTYYVPALARGVFGPTAKARAAAR